MRPTRRDLRSRIWSAGGKALVRRLRVVASKGVKWALEGHEDLDGNVESEQVEVFPGVGFYSRPKAGRRVEAVVLKVGGESGHPAIVATRDQDGVKALGALAADESAVFNSLAHVTIKASGEVHIAAIGGTAAALATKADLDSLKSTINGWTPVANDGGAALKSALLELFPSWPVGTTKLRGE